MDRQHPHTDQNTDPLNLSQRTQVTLPILVLVGLAVAGIQLWGQVEMSGAIKRELGPINESLDAIKDTMGAISTEVRKNAYDINTLRRDVDDDRKVIEKDTDDRWRRADQALWCSHMALLNPGVKCPNPFATGLRDVDIDGVPSWVTPGWQTYIQKKESKP